MGFIDTSSPTKWGIFKIIAVILCVLIIVGVFLPWFWSETKTQEVTVHYEAVGTDFSDAWPIFFSALFSLLFIFLGYDININIENRPRRINELFSGMLAFLIFVDSAVIANMLSKSARVTGYTSVSVGIGAGLWLIVISSFLLMIFSFLLWRQRAQGAAAQAPVKTGVEIPAPTPPPPPPAPLSKEEIIAAFSRIPGITTKKATALYNAGFKSFSDLSAAPSDKIMAVKGITLKDVKNIKKEVEF